MTNKIELKHIAPYLPFDLKGIAQRDLMLSLLKKGDTTTLTGLSISDFSAGFIKPILRPMDDLWREGYWAKLKEEFEYDEYELRYGISAREIYFCLNHVIKEGETQPLGYAIFERLFQWHFDLFGLIQKGLAVDVNTLKK